MDGNLTIRSRSFYPTDAVDTGLVRTAFRAMSMDLARAVLGPDLFDQSQSPAEVKAKLAGAGAVKVADLLPSLQLAETATYLRETFGEKKSVGAAELFGAILDDGLEILKRNQAVYPSATTGTPGLAGWDQLYVDDRIQVQELLGSGAAKDMAPPPLSKGALSVFELLLVPTHLGGHSETVQLADVSRSGTAGLQPEIDRLGKVVRPEVVPLLDQARHFFSSEPLASWSVIELLSRLLEKGSKTFSSPEKRELKAALGALAQRVKSRPLSAADAKRVKEHVDSIADSALFEPQRSIGLYTHNFHKEVVQLHMVTRGFGAEADMVLRLDRNKESIGQTFADDKLHLAFDRAIFDVEVKNDMTAEQVAQVIAKEICARDPGLKAEVLPMGGYPQPVDSDSIILKITRAAV